MCHLEHQILSQSLLDSSIVSSHFKIDYDSFITCDQGHRQNDDHNHIVALSDNLIFPDLITFTFKDNQSEPQDYDFSLASHACACHNIHPQMDFELRYL